MGILKLLGAFSQCFVVALIYVLCAYPLLDHFGGPTVLVGEDVFRGTAPVLTGTALLLTRVGASVVAVLYFLILGRYLIGSIFRLLGNAPGLFRLAAGLLAIPILIYVPGAVISAAAAISGGAVYSEALSGFTAPPLAVVVPVTILAAALSSGMTREVQGEPPFLTGLFANLAASIRALPARIEQGLSTGTDLMQGGYVKVTFALLGIQAAAVGIGAEDPAVYALIFAVPLVCALRDVLILWVSREAMPELLAESGVRRLVAVVVLAAAAVIASALMLRVGAAAINLYSARYVLPIEDLVDAFREAPLTKGAGVLLAVVAPAMWVALSAAEALRPPLQQGG